MKQVNNSPDLAFRDLSIQETDAIPKSPRVPSALLKDKCYRMKNTMLRSLSLLGISLAMAFSVAAQDVPKVKTSDKEDKYKSEDLKMKQKKEEYKYKSDELKKKDEKEERKVKAKV